MRGYKARAIGASGDWPIEGSSSTWLMVIFFLCLLLCVGLNAGCGGKKIDSRWRDRDIVMDGIPDEWQGARTYIEKPNIAIGVMNDETHLYVSLSTPVRSVAAQIMAMGFTVWLDPAGGKQKTFGIRCPVGFEDFKMMREAAGEPEKLEDLFDQASTRLEILGPGDGESATVLNDGKSGIEVCLSQSGGTLGYELRVPLTPTGESTYALGGDMSGPVGIGFETPEVDTEAMRESMGGERPHGGRGPRGPGGMGGGVMGDEGMPRPGMPGGGMQGAPEPLKIWTKVRLARDPENATP